MYYQAELDYLSRVLEKMHLPVRTVHGDHTDPSQFDMGLRRFLGIEIQPLPGGAFNLAKENTIYRLSDNFRCHYLFLLLPGMPTVQGLIIGPYTTDEVTREQVMELAEKFAVPTSRIRRLEEHFFAIPIVRDQATLMALFTTLGEVMWGSSEVFELIDVDVEQDLYGVPAVQGQLAHEDTAEDVLWRMKNMETRYTYENELLEMVSQGRYHRAHTMLSNVSELVFEQRTTDPLRNMKNYAIIYNTLLRKAAERGGVHPLHIDTLSSHFAHRIENISAQGQFRPLLGEMVQSYCRLVRKHASAHYSTPVQKAVAYIENDLSGDLSLRTLAGAQNISAGYLSTLFRKETNKTLTEYVTERRMDAGARLLRTTRLQVQTVAQHCGISDVNYFTKLFKKHYGITPNQLRKQTAHQKKQNNKM